MGHLFLIEHRAWASNYISYAQVETTIVVSLPTNSSDASSASSKTGFVALGVLGAFAFVFIVVVILVPCVRWRKRKHVYVRSASRSPSRDGSRRSRHQRLPSEYNQDTVAPLLEAEDNDGMQSEQRYELHPRPSPSVVIGKCGRDRESGRMVNARTIPNDATGEARVT